MNTLSTATNTTRELDVYLRLLAGPKPSGRLIEIRYPAVRGRMRQVFTPAVHQAQAAKIITSLAARSDVYIGVLLRDRRAGGADAVSESHLLWAEIDQPDALDRLTAFSWPPTLIISSGSAGHAHAYWLLRKPIAAELVAAYNQRLALALGGDEASVDAARILRPPNTLNHKHTPPTPVRIAAARPTRRYQLGALIDTLPPPPPRRSASPPAARSATGRAEDQLLRSVPAETYVQALTSREPDRTGKIACPFHDDSTPSLQLYEDGTWYCYGACQAGGSIYDFAARLWHLDTKGRDFLQLRERLLARCCRSR